MKKHMNAMKSLLFLALFAAFSISSHAQSRRTACPQWGTADCPLVKECPLAGKPECPLVKAAVATASVGIANCPLAGTPDCPLIKNCPKKGTSDCPYAAANVASASVVADKGDAGLPACCRKN